MKIGQKPMHALCEIPDEQKKCPQGVKNIFLSRNYPTRAIYVGFNNDKVHLDFLKLIVGEVKKLKTRPIVNILIPRTEDLEAYDFLNKYFRKSEYDFLNYIPTSSDTTVWAQDYFELLFDTEKGYSQVVDLPYFDREGEFIPASIALSCQKYLLQHPPIDPDNPTGNGDYGGNIEPLSSKILTVGNNMSEMMFKTLSALTTQRIIDIDVQWLETGHVDEVFSTLPHSENAGPCEQTLYVASPGLGLKIIDQLPKNIKHVKSDLRPYADDENVWPDLDFCLYPKNQSLRPCQEFRKANKVYQKSIDESVHKVQQAFKELHKCSLKVEKLPQLFVPLNEEKKYGSYKDRSVSLNPNSVNNIFFYPNLILPKQTFGPFQKEVEKVLENTRLKIIYADGKYVHELNGGVHCASKVAYSCTP